MTALSIEYSKLFEETKKASLRTNPMNRGFSDIKVDRLPDTISPSIVGAVVAFSIAPEGGGDKVLFWTRHKKAGLFMSANTLPPPSIFHMLEKNVGKRVLIFLSQSYGFEGVLVAITHEPPGVWLSGAEAVVFRATIVNPIPQITGREDRSEIFVNLNAVQRIEVLHEGRE